jgi:hypothetical protein
MFLWSRGLKEARIVSLVGQRKPQASLSMCRRISKPSFVALPARYTSRAKPAVIITLRPLEPGGAAPRQRPRELRRLRVNGRGVRIAHVGPPRTATPPPRRRVGGRSGVDVVDRMASEPERNQSSSRAASSRAFAYSRWALTGLLLAPTKFGLARH